MQIYSLTFRPTNFKSRNNPIKPFVVNTPKGKLYVREFSKVDAGSTKEAKKLATFFLDSFINNTKDPWFLSLKQNNEKYDDAITHFTDYYRSMFKKDDGNLTMLVAHNKDKKLCGAVVTNTFNESGVNDSLTCYIDSVAVSPKFRKCGVGRLLMDKAISCSFDVYKDAFLASDNLAVPFQLKNGFKPLDYSNINQQKIINKINANRGDYPDYITFMYKNLKETGDVDVWAERVTNSSNL